MDRFDFNQYVAENNNCLLKINNEKNLVTFKKIFTKLSRYIKDGKLTIMPKSNPGLKFHKGNGNDLLIELFISDSLFSEYQCLVQKDINISMKLFSSGINGMYDDIELTIYYNDDNGIKIIQPETEINMLHKMDDYPLLVTPVIKIEKSIYLNANDFICAYENVINHCNKIHITCERNMLYFAGYLGEKKINEYNGVLVGCEYEDLDKKFHYVYNINTIRKIIDFMKMDGKLVINFSYDFPMEIIINNPDFGYIKITGAIDNIPTKKFPSLLNLCYDV